MTLLRLRTLFTSAAFAFAACSLRAASNWPQWRGPDGQGHAVGTGFPLKWSEKENVAWKTTLPGRGWSSPVVWGDQIWMTSAVEIASSPDKAKDRLKANTNDQPVTVLEEVVFHALCVDRSTGKLIHDVELHHVKEPQWVHQLNSYATPTPVVENGRLYCHFGTFGTVCVDTTSAQVLWKNQEIQLMHENGPGSSPVLWKNLVVIHCDGSDVQFVVGLDKQTGKEIWRTARSGKLDDKPITHATYSTPLVLDGGSDAQVISTGPDWLYGYDPANGKELWKMAYDTQGFAMSARAVSGDGMIFYSTGFMKPHLQAVKWDGKAAPEMAWDYPKGVPTMASPLLEGGLLYFVSDGGIVTCLTAAKGKQVYRERLEGDFNASPTLANGRLYIPSREGKTYVVAAGEKFELLATNELEGLQMATAAAVDGTFFIRTDKALYCITSPAR